MHQSGGGIALQDHKYRPIVEIYTGLFVDIIGIILSYLECLCLFDMVRVL